MLVVNDAYRLAPRANWLYACDDRWWRFHHEAVTAVFQGERWTQDEAAAKRYGLNWIQGKSEPGLSRDPNVIHHGANSGYQAINLAYHFGAKRIILLGYDMHGSHFFGEHPAELPVKSSFSVFLANFPQLAADLKAEGVEVVNCTPGSVLHSFHEAPLREVL